ncbi:MAG: hypothetical protein ABSF43_01950 [Rectinemataceae bacterium]|jgi:hypothetical protein
MRRYARHSPDRDFRHGLDELTRHRPDLAVRRFRAAVSSCPAAKAGELSRDLYWLAVALLRLDRPELAIRSLVSAQKLRPRSIARSAYEMRVNAYGMCRRSNPELDDYYAFYSIKAWAYLEAKKQGRFETNVEKDIVTRLIGDAWRALIGSGTLSGLPASRKLALFKSWPIAFPLFGLERNKHGKIVDADFRRGGKLRGDERCSCGSGLPFMRCCGRISSLRERSCE